MLDEKINSILEEVKRNYNPEDVEELTIWLDGLLNSEVCE